jgi:hypothetical protein
MPIERIDRKEYASFGQCIYCGAAADQVALTDEHIVPFSLGGNAVILEGSCKACASETTKLEDEIARKVFLEFRTHVDAPTRRKKKRAKELPFTFKSAGGEAETKTVRVADHPFFASMPVWGLPGLLDGKLPSAEFEHHKAHVFYWLPPNIREVMGLADGVVGEIPFPEFRINHQRFARGIAKIAYCQAVATLGLHNFRHLALPDLILGRYPNIPYFVGCKIEDPPQPADRSVAHVIQIGIEKVNDILLVVGTVRLFANSGVEDHGPPIYEVVVGAPRRVAGK